MEIARWNSGLFESLTANAVADSPLFLYVDRVVLRDVLGTGASAPEALADFIAAYQAEMDSARPFSPWKLGVRTWLSEGAIGVPPFFAALCMTVLAVTEPAQDKGSGVYASQNHLLGFPAVTSAPPRYTEDVPLLWRQWNRWLKVSRPDLGFPTANSHPNWTYQGWARSQTRIRDRDRDLLFDFFDSHRTTGAESGQELLFALDEWLRFQASDYDRVRKLCGDEQTRAILQTILPSFLSSWFRIDSEARPRRAAVSLMADSATYALDLVIKLEDCSWLRGQDVEIVKGVKETVGLQDSILYLTARGKNAFLLDGTQRRSLSASVSFRWEPRDVILLEPWHRETFAEARESVWGRQYVALVAVSALPTFLETAARFGASPVVREMVLPAWRWVTGIRFSIDAELSGFSRPSWAPSGDRGSHLVGGMPLGRSQVYLERGEPDLVLSSIASLDEVILDGKRLEGFDTATSLVRLRNEYLDPGLHRIESDGSALAFRVEAPTRIRQVRWPDAHKQTGASVTSSHEPDLVRFSMQRSGSAEIAIITSVGRTYGVEVESIDPPKWISAVGMRPMVMLDLESVIPRRFEGEVAFVAFRSSSRAAWTVIDVQQGTRFSGHTTVRRSPISLAEFVTAPKTWLSQPNSEKLSEIVHAARARPRDWSETESRSNEHVVRKDVKVRRDTETGPISSENAFDTFLAWMSELESGRASFERADQVWSWIQEFLPVSAAATRVASCLSILERYGHIEVDSATRSIQLRELTLVDLRNAMGTRALIGARPERVLDAFSDGGEDDEDIALASMAQHVVLHRVRQSGPDGFPSGPDALFVELEEYSGNESDLSALGFAKQRSSSSWLTSLEKRANASPEWVDVWGADRQVLRIVQWSRLSWAPVSHSTDSLGVGKYATSRGPVVTYKKDRHSKEKVLDLASAIWLAASEVRPSGLVSYQPSSGTLLVPAVLPLPMEFARGLVHRSGLLPRRTTIFQPRPESPSAEYDVYENCNLALATGLASALGQHDTDLVSSIDFEGKGP